jgi:hypothetical protein
MIKKILIAGIPRSGTTLLYDSLKKNSKVLAAKTHSLLSLEKSLDGISIDTSFSVVFIYGNPINSVISTYNMINGIYHIDESIGKEWWKRNHASNCGYLGNLENLNILEKDDLNYEKMFDEWMETKRFTKITVRYEKLFLLVPVISALLNVNLNLPPQRKRRTSYREEDANVVSQVKKDIRQSNKKS